MIVVEEAIRETPEGLIWANDDSPVLPYTILRRERTTRVLLGEREYDDSGNTASLQE